MELRNILVNLDVDFSSTNLLRLAADIAQRFGARVSEIAAATPPANLIAVEGGTVSVGLYEAEQQNIEKRLNSLESAFLTDVPVKLRDRCITMFESPTDALARAARRADLIVTQSQPARETSYARNLDIGGAILAAGRPVLVARIGATALDARHIVVGWKDTREARRALVDALPFLKAAEDVLVIAVEEHGAYDKATLDDVVDWLHSHDVKARAEARPALESHAATLLAAAAEIDSRLIVTGAYGHSRLRERIFGGVTRDLLEALEVHRLMSN